MERILVAIDGSAESLEAVNLAGELARATGAKVTAASIYGIEPIATMAGYAVPEDVTTQWRTQLQSDLDGPWTAPLRALGLDVATVVDEGRPEDALLHLARDQHADLIVMGSHGRGSVRGMFLGSVSHFLTLHAPCPVLIVPPGSSHKHAAAIPAAIGAN